VSTELTLIALVLGSLAVTALCRRYGLPAPLVLVVAGLLASLAPGVVEVTFDPNVVMLLVLTPLLYSAGLGSSYAGIRANLRPIGLLAIGLVAFTTVVVGFVAWWVVPGLTLPAGLVLGAIVAPPDAVSALTVGRRLGLPRYESLQPLYNLYDRAPFEDALQALCVEEGLGVINFYALARGFLSGKYRTAADAAKSPRGGAAVSAYLNPRGLRILAALDEVAAASRATAAQVALAWQMARPGITAPIASATSVAQLDELVGAARLELDAAAVARLDEASA